MTIVVLTHSADGRGSQHSLRASGKVPVSRRRNSERTTEEETAVQMGRHNGGGGPPRIRYASFLDGLKARIRAAQVKAALAVNAELVLLDWHVGRDIRAARARGLGSARHRPAQYRPSRSLP